MTSIETGHLRLIPQDADRIRAIMLGADEYTRVSGLAVADGLADLYTTGDVSPAFLERMMGPQDGWIHGFAIVVRESDVVVGMCGFKGPPDDNGIVEIAYGIAASCQNRGYATEAAAALVEFARTDSRVRRVVAHTLPDPNASTRVLTKCGFTFAGDVVDPDDGPVWKWEMQLPVPPAK